jgi:hypothetical protein
MHNEELYNLYASPSIIKGVKPRTNGYVEHVARMGKMRNAYNILVGKLERKRSLGRPWRGWEDNIRMNLREIGWEGVDWMHLAHGRDYWTW